jgi:hypothetical protein
MNRIASSRTAALVLATLMLAACGGGDYTVATPPPPTDDGLTQAQREDRAASASVMGLFSFAVAMLDGQTSESSEPRAIADITPPASDDIEPAAVPQ